jgi:hypothetical protein
MRIVKTLGKVLLFVVFPLYAVYRWFRFSVGSLDDLTLREIRLVLKATDKPKPTKADKDTERRLNELITNPENRDAAPKATDASGPTIN